MLTVYIPGQEGWNEASMQFVSTEPITLVLEHSLLSVGLWESKWKRPFLSRNQQLTDDEIRDYIRCMIIKPEHVSDETVALIPPEKIAKIWQYVNDRQTATVVHSKKTGRSNETPTAELIYYWMLECGIPFECENWHLSRLLTLIEVCGVKRDSSNNKMSKNEIYTQNAAINAANRARFHSKG